MAIQHSSLWLNYSVRLSLLGHFLWGDLPHGYQALTDTPLSWMATPIIRVTGFQIETFQVGSMSVRNRRILRLECWSVELLYKKQFERLPFENSKRLFELSLDAITKKVTVSISTLLPLKKRAKVTSQKTTAFHSEGAPPLTQPSWVSGLKNSDDWVCSVVSRGNESVLLLSHSVLYALKGLFEVSKTSGFPCNSEKVAVSGGHHVCTEGGNDSQLLAQPFYCSQTKHSGP